MELPKVTPAEEDLQVFMRILSCVDRLNGSDKAGKLRDAVIKAGILKSNRDELKVLLGELGICGILASNDFPAYDTYFANEYERDSVEPRNEFAYPVNRWHARDGINTTKLNAIFGFALTPDLYQQPQINNTGFSSRRDNGHDASQNCNPDC